MPTKTKQTTKKKNADIQERAKWRWEFLRRGEVYIRAYERFKHKYQGWILCGLDPSWLGLRNMPATKDRLYTGLYECTECDARYIVEDASQDDLICDECGADLEMEDDRGHGNSSADEAA